MFLPLLACSILLSSYRSRSLLLLQVRHQFRDYVRDDIQKIFFFSGRTTKVRATRPPPLDPIVVHTFSFDELKYFCLVLQGSSITLLVVWPLKKKTLLFCVSSLKCSACFRIETLGMDHNRQYFYTSPVTWVRCAFLQYTEKLNSKTYTYVRWGTLDSDFELLHLEKCVLNGEDILFCLKDCFSSLD